MSQILLKQLMRQSSPILLLKRGVSTWRGNLPTSSIKPISSFNTSSNNPYHASLAAFVTNPSNGLLSTWSNRSYSTGKRGPPHPSESFLQGNSSVYVEEMYNAWLKNHDAVHKSWDVFFRGVTAGVQPGEAYQAPPTLRGTSSATDSFQSGPLPAYSDIQKEISDHLKLQLLVRAYQVSGNDIATLDPLGISSPDLDNSFPEDLKLETYGFTEKDLDRKFNLGSTGLMQGLLGTSEHLTLREIITTLKETYTENIGYEYMHILSRTECNWIRSHIEKKKVYALNAEEKKVILDRLIWADSFEKFISKKWKNEKRFGLEGCEALIPGMKSLIDHAADLGTENIVLGMAHRGRLNVLGNVIRKPLEQIFNEFSGTTDPSDSFSGDVKYHLGMNFARPTRSGKRINLSLVANPSHLETVNPVVMGKARALQHCSEDNERQKTVSLLLHGDAAFAGQGVVYESLGLTNLPSYTTGGVIHLVINNQIGFTTDPRFSRSSPYCTDVAKTIQAPIFHVNADDPEAVVFACNLAADYRSTFKKDVVVDLICYRRHGHNEVDQPAFTQPKMYKHIEKHPPVLNLYSAKLIKEGTITQEEFDQMQAKVNQILETSYQKKDSYKALPDGWTTSSWMVKKKETMTLAQLQTTVSPIRNTGVSISLLKSIGEIISTVPENFSLHSGLKKIMDTKHQTILNGKGIDMPTAEALAFGTLLLEGNHVRLSGQDVERGTFSQRHAVLHDQNDESVYVPLNHLTITGQKQREFFTVTNSHLSEYAVMGFELGYSLVNPDSLIIWEAQFGDFANTAQAMIDQYVVSGEKKWLQRTGLVLSLPHGYDGAGPEHSSGRMERFLQLMDDSPFVVPNMEEGKRRQIQDANLQVVYPSTPANLFHVLRRQLHREFRKPLALFFSKSLLRHPLARSSFEEMAEGTRFKRVIPDPDPEIKPTRMIFCSGQVYYALLKYRQENKLKNVALHRVEQIAPFPYDRVIEQINKFPNAEVIWCQEEPLNAGAWSYVEPRMRLALQHIKHKQRDVFYAGRDPSAATATGNKKQHHYEEDDLISMSFYGKKNNRNSH